MAENSKIEWTDHTFNGWIGCTRVSPGCKNCYAAESTPTRVARSNGRELWGKGQPRQRTSAANWKNPIRWNKAPSMCCPDCGLENECGCGFVHRPRVFCASLSDWLDDEVPIEWLADLIKLIHDTPNLDWQLLTKRPENWRERCFEALHRWEEIRFHNSPTMDSQTEFSGWLSNWIGGHESPSNVWIGVTCEDQKRADERIPHLLKIPAKVRFLSVEPMLEEVFIKYSGEFCRCNLGIDNLGDRSCSWIDLDKTKCCSWARYKGLHWVICGGESGNKRRPFDCDWARSLRDQCKSAGVAFFMKQVDKVQPIPEDLMIREFPL
jgi:protein gp37